MPDVLKAESLNQKVKSLGGELIAVSKKFTDQDVKEVSKAGILDFGENYVSEAVDKIEKLKDLNLRWHFIGRVQSGNLNKIINRFHLIHSICKLEHLRKINERSLARQRVLVQLQHDEDERGFGLKENELLAFLKAASCFEQIELAGLMFMPPAQFDEKKTEDSFKWAAGVFEKTAEEMLNLDSWKTLSMGMSRDYIAALKAGSTHVRMGTAIFGERTQS